MFIGHFALGMAAKKFAPKTSLATLFLSVQFADLLWPVLLILGVEHVRIAPGITVLTPLDFYDYPISHSLVMGVVWGLLLALIYYAMRRDRTGAAVIGAGVLSHWVLDVVTHRPDMPVMPGSQLHAGMGLWNHPIAAILLESLMYIAGIIIYVRSTWAVDRTGTYAFWALAIFLAISWIAALTSVPPNESALGWGGLSLWLIIGWGYWIDKHRTGSAGTVTQR